MDKENNNSNDTDSPNDKENNEENEEQDTTIYATALTLNCINQIDLKTNTSVVLIGDYITVVPSEAVITVTITAQSGNMGGLVFENNIINNEKKCGIYSQSGHLCQINHIFASIKIIVLWLKHSFASM